MKCVSIIHPVHLRQAAMQRVLRIPGFSRLGLLIAEKAAVAERARLYGEGTVITHALIDANLTS
jgi:hypothetical protein